MKHFITLVTRMKQLSFQRITAIEARKQIYTVRSKNLRALVLVNIRD